MPGSFPANPNWKYAWIAATTATSVQQLPEPASVVAGVWYQNMTTATTAQTPAAGQGQMTLAQGVSTVSTAGWVGVTAKPSAPSSQLYLLTAPANSEIALIVQYAPVGAQGAAA